MDLNGTWLEHSENSYKWPLIQASDSGLTSCFSWCCCSCKEACKQDCVLKNKFLSASFFLWACQLSFWNPLLSLLWFGWVFPPQDFTVIYVQTTKALDSCTKLFASSSKPWVTLQTMIWFVSALCAFMLFIFSFGNCIKPIALVIICRICVEFPLLGNFTNKLQATFYASLNLICHFSVQLFQNKKYSHCNWIFKENKLVFIVFRLIFSGITAVKKCILLNFTIES